MVGKVMNTICNQVKQRESQPNDTVNLELPLVYRRASRASETVLGVDIAKSGI